MYIGVVSNKKAMTMTKNKDGASKMKPPIKKITSEDLQIEISLLNEQLWYTQEALRRLMLLMSEQTGPQGAEAIVNLLTEWTQIIHNINKDHGKGRGFQPVHAEIGTSMANFFEKNGFLTPKQVAYWQKETLKVKKPRICRYAGQMVEEALLKMENK